MIPTYYLDENIPYGIYIYLKSIGIQVEHQRHVFECGTKDEIWVPEVIRQGWFFLTTDHRLRNRSIIKVILAQEDACGLFLYPRFCQQIWTVQEAWIKRYWQRVDRAFRNTDPGCYWVSDKGKLSLAVKPTDMICSASEQAIEPVSV